MTQGPSTCPVIHPLMASERFHPTGYQMEQKKLIGYMSHSLSSAEWGYSQFEKEALAIIFGFKKFHQYLFGKHCTIVAGNGATAIGPLGRE